MAVLTTGADSDVTDCGEVRLDTGYGSLLVCASREESYGEVVADLSGAHERVTCTVVLRRNLSHLGEWRELRLAAPRETVRDETKTEEQAAQETARAEEMAKIRQKRLEGFYQEREVQRVLMRFVGEDRDKIQEILKQARGNMGEIVRFLEWDFAGQTMALEQCYGREGWKRKALEALSPNDYWDISAEVLADASICAAPYAGSVPEKVFFMELLNPCTGFERARAHRRALRDCLKENTRREIRQDPGCVEGVIRNLVRAFPKEEYANLVTSPIGCLTGGMGSELSGKVLCVNLLRAVGIPARIGRMDRTLEYYKDGRFERARREGTTDKAHRQDMVCKAGAEKNHRGNGTSNMDGGGKDACASGWGTVTLRTGDSLEVSDWKHYSLARFQRGHFEPLFLGARNADSSKEGMKREQKDCLVLSLEEGIYRIVTTNRLPNGSQLVKLYDFALKGGEEKEIALSMHQILAEEMLEQMPVDDFSLMEEGGGQVRISSLAGEGKALLLWLDLTREPSEHILNELYEKRESYGKILGPIYFVVSKRASYREDATFQRTCRGLPRAKVLLDDFGERYALFARQVGRNPGKLPLAAVLEGGARCVFSDAGYNVGMADTLLQILECV